MGLQGCDGSALFGASATRTIEEVSGELGRKCGRVVSCVDIIALAARDAVSIGRRDGLKVVAMKDQQTSIPPPTAKTDDMISSFAPKNFTITEMGLLASDEDLNMDYRTGAIAEGSAFDRDFFPTDLLVQ
ncbi:peroxidase 12-like [Primulina huaijiensis]|uniref:peroxidase 12-like n=1 Tax=Primulina huaijiensis TaxID=1492673 RepID=UPI003CC700EF